MDASRHGPVAFERRLGSATDRYLDRLADGVAALPTLVERYGAGREYRATLAGIRRHESECDAIKLELGRLLADATHADVTAPPAWDRRYADRTLHVYEHLDAIANAAGQFAAELVALAPARREGCLEGLAEMAALAASATDELGGVVAAFVRALCRRDDGVSITDGVSTIRAIEGEAEAVGNRALEAALAGERDGDAAAYRRLAVLLDGVLDSIGDVTDQIHLATGTDGWPDIEVYPPCGR
jgi:uncharacterized protein Yka (UPF0111/DUF47 family)